MVLPVLATVLLVSVTVPEMALLAQDMVPDTVLLVLATVHLEKAMALAMVPLVADMAAVLAAMVTGPEVMEPFLRLPASVKMVVSLTRLAPTSALEVTKALPIFHLEACSTLLSASAQLAVSTISISISPMEEDSQALVALVALVTFLAHSHKTKRHTRTEAKTVDSDSIELLFHSEAEDTEYQCELILQVTCDDPWNENN